METSFWIVTNCMWRISPEPSPRSSQSSVRTRWIRGPLICSSEALSWACLKESGRAPPTALSPQRFDFARQRHKPGCQQPVGKRAQHLSATVKLMCLRSPQPFEGIDPFRLFSHLFILVIKPAPAHVVTEIRSTGIPDDRPVKQMGGAVPFAGNTAAVPIIGSITKIQVETAAQDSTLPGCQANSCGSRGS